MTTYEPSATNMNPAEGYDTSPETIPQRKKLLLKPRSVPSELIPRLDHGKAVAGAKNPFGSAVPREAVLQQRGIQVSTLDEKFERKAKVRHYTIEQDLALDKVRAELSEITADLRHANEHELPEEAFRQAEQAKRDELNALLEQFARLNDGAAAATTGHGTPTDRRLSIDRAQEEKGLRRSHDRPTWKVEPRSERRTTWTHTPLEEKKDDDLPTDAYASFMTNRKRRDE